MRETCSAVSSPGFAHSIGIDAYMRLLEQTVKQLKGEEEGREFPDPEVSITGSAYLPDSYISDSGQKLHLYQRLSKLSRMAEVTSLREELADRFGAPPVHVEHLLDGAALRILGRRIGVERIIVRQSEARVNFRATVVPRLSVLKRPLQERSVDVEVRRMTPLSLVLHQTGPDSLVSTLIPGPYQIDRGAGRGGVKMSHDGTVQAAARGMCAARQPPGVARPYRLRRWVTMNTSAWGLLLVSWVAAPKGWSSGSWPFFGRAKRNRGGFSRGRLVMN